MKKISLTVVGDIFPANLHYTIGFGIESQFYNHQGKPWLQRLHSFFKDSDIAFGNLESPLIKDDQFAATNCFAGSNKFASFLKQVGINIVSIANNHILEQGPEGFYSTLRYLENNQIRYVGKKTNNFSNIATIKCKGMKIGFAGFNAIQDIKNPDLYAEYKEDFVLKALKKMDKMNLDYKILSIHWGDEFINIPSLKQINAAHKFIDNGADIIVGHHPHVVQPVESYKKGLIFYSLGNFMFDMIWSKNVRRGMTANLTLEKGENIKFDVVPIFIGKNYIPYRIHNDKKNDYYLKKNSESISLLNEYSTKKYQKFYERKRKTNLLSERIMMKLFLLKHLNKLLSKTMNIFLKHLLTKIKVK